MKYLDCVISVREIHGLPSGSVRVIVDQYPDGSFEVEFEADHVLSEKLDVTRWVSAQDLSPYDLASGSKVSTDTSEADRPG